MEQNTLTILTEALKSLIGKECTIEEKTIRKANRYGYVYFKKSDIGKKVRLLIYEDNKRDLPGDGQTDVSDELLSESEDLV